MNKIFDLHNDYYFKLKTDEKKDRYLKKNDEIAKNLVSAIWTSELSNEDSLRRIEEAKLFVNSHKNIFLGVEDLHFVTKSNLYKFLTTRPIYAGLTWNTSNCLAGGAHESGNLTNFGKQVLKLLEENSIKLDTAHLNEESFMDISKNATKSFFCSHACVYGVQPHKRNLKDYQIKMIIESGGIVGLCLVPEFISGTKNCSVADFVSHIDYFACKFGIDNLALGTDFYGTKYLPKSIKSYLDLSKNVSKELLKLGYTEKAIDKIFYTNAMNYMIS